MSTTKPALAGPQLWGPEDPRDHGRSDWRINQKKKPRWRPSFRPRATLTISSHRMSSTRRSEYSTCSSKQAHGTSAGAKQSTVVASSRASEDETRRLESQRCKQRNLCRLPLSVLFRVLHTRQTWEGLLEICSLAPITGRKVGSWMPRGEKPLGWDLSML